jgi:hypothetical protein
MQASNKFVVLHTASLTGGLMIGLMTSPTAELAFNGAHHTTESMQKLVGVIVESSNGVTALYNVLDKAI